MSENETAQMNANDLACYVIEYYKEHKQKEMSDISLQKILYFLFAYWGGFIRQGKIDENPEVMEQSEILFLDKIEAWTYGPVVAQLYYDKKDGVFDKYKKEVYRGEEELFGENELLKSTIDSLLRDLIELDPFRLVTISHRDKCWIKNYNQSEDKHHNEIEKEDIIQEYATRFSS